MNINQLAAQIGARMVEIVDCNVRLHVDTWDKTFEHLFEPIFNRFIGDDLPEWQYETVYWQVFEHMDVQIAVQVINERIREYLEDNAPVLVTHQDILDFHRMSDLLEVR